MTKKEHLKQISLAVPALLLAFTTLAAVPAFASRGSSNDSTVSADTTTTVSSDSARLSTSTSTSGSRDNTTENEAHTSLAVASDDSQTTELHSRGKELVAELQKEHKPKQTDSERQKVCETHKQGLINKFTVIARNSLAYQTRIDDIFAKVSDFQTTKSINNGDLTTLIATARAAQAASTASVTSLQAVKPPSIDCNNVSVAEDVATFKAAAAQTRTNLKTYKAAVKAVIQNLKAATTTDTTATSTTTIKTTEKSN